MGMQEHAAQPTALGPTSFAGLHLGAGSSGMAPARQSLAGPSNLLGMLHNKALLGGQENAASSQHDDNDIRSIIHGKKHASLAARRRW